MICPYLVELLTGCVQRLLSGFTGVGGVCAQVLPHTAALVVVCIQAGPYPAGQAVVVVCLHELSPVPSQTVGGVCVDKWAPTPPTQTNCWSCVYPSCAIPGRTAGGGVFVC